MRLKTVWGHDDFGSSGQGYNGQWILVEEPPVELALGASSNHWRELQSCKMAGCRC